MNLLFDFLPLALFLAAFFLKDIFVAITVLMIAMPIGLLLKYIKTKELDKMYFWSTVFLLVGGSLTLYFRNPVFLYWKPTVFYWVVAAAFLISQLFMAEPLVKRFFSVVEGIDLAAINDNQWRWLNLSWVVFFVAVGLGNLYVAYNFDEATWVKFKVFGLTVLTFIFMLGQTLWIVNIAGGVEDKD